MNFLLTTFYLTSVLNLVKSAPAVSSVHVSFVSGNKATQYSHDIGGSSPLSHYNNNLLSSPSIRKSHRDETGEIHLKRKRSILSSRELISPTQGSTTFTTPKFYKKNPIRPLLDPKFSRKFYTSTTHKVPTDETTLDPTVHTPIASSSTSRSSLLKRLMRNRVAFVEPSPTTISAYDTVTMSEGSLLSELSTPTNDILKSESIKPRDSKAVKRSPFIADNFDAGGVQFPDFDEFGGDEFGSLRNFGGSHGNGGGRGSVGSHTHANPEALSPDGVFLPPLPTEASPDYADSDPYLADPDTAKYAAQHPPFFAAFPHKRTIVSLNEQRVHNGLEPNILRSIRPYFAFFDVANPHYPGHVQHQDSNELEYHSHLEGPSSPPLSYAHFDSSSHNLFHTLEPNQYESEVSSQPVTSWSIFKK